MWESEALHGLLGILGWLLGLATIGGAIYFAIAIQGADEEASEW